MKNSDALEKFSQWAEDLQNGQMREEITDWLTNAITAYFGGEYRTFDEALGIHVDRGKSNLKVFNLKKNDRRSKLLADAVKHISGDRSIKIYYLQIAMKQAKQGKIQNPNLLQRAVENLVSEFPSMPHSRSRLSELLREIESD